MDHAPSCPLDGAWSRVSVPGGTGRAVVLREAVEDRGAEFDRVASSESSLFLKRKPWPPAA